MGLAEETGITHRADSWMGQTGSGRDRANVLQGNAPAEKGSAPGNPGDGGPASDSVVS